MPACSPPPGVGTELPDAVEGAVSERARRRCFDRAYWRLPYGLG